MTTPNDRRVRASHHEAGHAVIAAVLGYNVVRTFLTADTTADGRVGGYTGWDNPLGAPKNPTQKDFLDHVGNVVCILHSGQYAEHHLRMLAPEIEVPEHDPNWDNDDSDARRFLALAQNQWGLRMPPEETFRVLARRYVERFWSGIVRLAWLLSLDAPSNVQPQQAHVETSGGILAKPLLPAGCVLFNGDVRDCVRQVYVAEAAYLHWIDRGRAPGGTFDDWRHGDRIVAR
jgi:hypothetical protein